NAHIGGAERSARWRDETELESPGDRLTARLRVELPEDRRDVVIYSPSRYDEALGDLRVLEPFAEQDHNLSLPSGQPRRVLACPWARPARQSSDPTRPQPALDHGSCRMRLQPAELVEPPQHTLLVSRSNL